MADVAVVERLEVRFGVLIDPLVDGACASVLTGLIPRDEIRLLGARADGGGRRRRDEGDCGTILRDTRRERRLGGSDVAGVSTGWA